MPLASVQQCAVGFRLNCYCLLTANAPPSAVLAGPWVVWMEKQMLLRVIGDGAAAVAESGLVAQIHCLELSPVLCGQAGLRGLGPGCS